MNIRNVYVSGEICRDNVYATTTLKIEAAKTDLLVFEKGICGWVRLEDKMEIRINKYFETNIKQPIMKAKESSDVSLNNVVEFEDMEKGSGHEAGDKKK